MKKTSLYLLMYLAGIAVVLFLMSPPRDVDQVPYSAFKQMVRAGAIAEAVVDEHQIRGTLKEAGRRFATTRIDDPHLLEDLEQHGVSFTGGVEVTEFGMSEIVGPVSYKARSRPQFLVSATPAEPLAEETAREIDLEVKSLVVDAHTRARAILTQYRKPLDTLTRLLMEREVVEGSDIRMLVERASPEAPRAA